MPEPPRRPNLSNFLSIPLYACAASIHYRPHTLPEQSPMCIFPRLPFTGAMHILNLSLVPHFPSHIAVLLPVIQDLISSTRTLKLYKKQRRKIHQLCGTYLPIVPGKNRTCFPLLEVSMCFLAPTTYPWLFFSFHQQTSFPTFFQISLPIKGKTFFIKIFTKLGVKHSVFII